MEKRLNKNEKGFTLVELLAVIVILGLLMAIAIPSVTKYITQSRKKTLISSVNSYVTAVTTAVNDNAFGAMSNEDIMYYIPVSNDENNSCVSLEKGGTDPFGNWKEAYVVVNYDSEKYSYDYYFTFYDDAGYGMALTKIDEIDASSNKITNPSPVNADNIAKQKNERATTVKVLTSSSCRVEHAIDNGVGILPNDKPLYFGKPYVGIFEEAETAIIFYEDGSAEWFAECVKTDSSSAGFYQYVGNKILWDSDDENYGLISGDKTSVTDVEQDVTFYLDTDPNWCKN